jgi:hypothetical protein
MPVFSSKHSARVVPTCQRRAGEFFIVRNVGNIVLAVGRGVIGGVDPRTPWKIPQIRCG